MINLSTTSILCIIAAPIIIGLSIAIYGIIKDKKKNQDRF